MDRKLVITAAFLLCIGIVLGAVGAHIVKPKISQDQLFVFEKAVRYQMYGAFGMLILGLASDKLKVNLNIFYYLTLAGILVFSGGLYCYSCHEIVPAFKVLARFVPIGGFALIGSWLVLGVQVIRQKQA